MCPTKAGIFDDIPAETREHVPVLHQHSSVSGHQEIALTQLTASRDHGSLMPTRVVRLW